MEWWEEKCKYCVSDKYNLQVRMLMVGTEAWVTRWGQNKQHPGTLLRRSTTESSRLAPTLQPASALPKMPQERSVLHKQLQAHYGFLWCLSCSGLSINSTTNRASGPGFSQFIQQIFIEPLVSTVCQAQGAFSCLWPPQAYDGTPSTGQISGMSFAGGFWPQWLLASCSQLGPKLLTGSHQAP